MQAHASERQRFERQLCFARPVFWALALGVFLEQGTLDWLRREVVYVSAYLVLAICDAVADRWDRSRRLRLPLEADFAAVAVFLLLTPSVVAFWFPFLLLSYAAALRWDKKRAGLLAGAYALAVLGRSFFLDAGMWSEPLAAAAMLAATFLGGAGAVELATRQRRHASQQEFLARLSLMLQVEQGIAESVRRVLAALAEAFECEEALLVFLEEDLERLFVWRLRQGESGRITPESVPAAKADAFLMDQPDATVCWNSLEGPGEGFGWNRRDGKPLAEIPRLPGPSRQALGLRSLLAASFDLGGRPVGRILLANGRRKYAPHHLHRLEQVVGHLGPQFENLLLLRHLRARAIEAERGRMARDIHDGILQSLLSFQIQLDVLRRMAPEASDRLVRELAALQQTLRNETDELRRMVTDMRPLRVQSADLLDLMQGLAERFRTESGIGLDLLVDSAELEAPDRVCRELFQIYREALQNVKKHAHATHVVVKLSQGEEKLSLVVDDNGQGFSFAGRFTSEELDRLRLGPISIKERTRSLGGVLTVESNPGHGARLTVEIPLG